MTKQNRKTVNGVNGTSNSSSRDALGESVSQQQGTFDRHPITACNLRKKTRIATWNARTMNQPGKLECITKEASRLKLDVLGLSEVRWLGSRNGRGDMWVDWCMAHDQVIMNTWFQHHKIHLYTWKSPGDGVRNQIDYITINKRFHNSILQVKGYPGADGGSDRRNLETSWRPNFLEPMISTEISTSREFPIN